MIPVTKTFFPPIEDYNEQLKRIWENGWLTNRGELVRELELKLKTLLEVPFLTLSTNGTLPIQIALKILAKEGEVITTPFSYVATTSAVVWENCTPVFVDIHPEYLTIDENKIEAAITSKTTAILATHVFGNPCEVEKIKNIAAKHDLKVIYDAAHAFNVKYHKRSIFNYGDVSTCSFHATKLFHTGEGGAMICQDEDLFMELFRKHNFGHSGPDAFKGIGINGKMSELQAAMGISVFAYLDKIYEGRKKIIEFYNQNLNFHKVRTMKIREGTEWNYSYYPLIFSSEEKLLEVVDVMKENEIVPRRYFYPSLNTLDYLETHQNMPVSEDIASRILCLPLYLGLPLKTCKLICEIINQLNEE
jgi:dTDP-4-amino-4,6-dideoxygalactose transaminase